MSDFKKENEKIEWVDIIDENENVIGKSARSECHNGSKLLHPVVHVHIINNENKILLQKRLYTKKIQPGKWDTSVGGHIESGESIESAVIREVKEEVGIDIELDKLITLHKYIYESDREKEFIYSYLYYYDGEIVFQESEIEKVNFFLISEIEELINNNLTTPNFIKEFELLKQNKIIS